VLWRTFGLKRDEMVGGWRKMHNEQLHNLYSLPNIIRMIKSRRMIRKGMLHAWGRSRMHIGFW
jgi:hypothetical protein